MNTPSHEHDHASRTTTLRLACLYVPDFPLAAVWRVDPDLRGAAVAVVDGHGPRATVLAVSLKAAQRGVRAGLTVAQAMAVAAGLTVRQAAPDVLRAAQAALCDAAESFSPRVEDAGNGLAYLDLSGLHRVHGSESQLATILSQRARHLGLDVQIGVAGSKVAAYLAARRGGGVAVIPPGEEWSFLAPVPLALLDPSLELAATLRRWGIRCIGELAALPANAVGTRLGPEGTHLLRRARGEDAQPLAPRPLPVHFEEGVDSDYGIDDLEAFLFVVRGLLARLTARVALRGFVCGDLRLSLRLATRGRDDRTVAVVAPSNDVKSLLALVRLHLEAHPPVAAIDAVRVVTTPEHLRAAQLDFFRPRGPAPERLAVSLARLVALCGADRVGAPAVIDSHRPETIGLAQFVNGVSGVGCREDRCREDRCRVSGVGGWGVANQHPAPDTQHPTCFPLALRAVRPPQTVEVFCERDRPAFVRGEGIAGRVVQAAGPWRVQGEWWSDDPYARDYYDAQLSDGGVYRLYCDVPTQHWFVDGVYD